MTMTMTSSQFGLEDMEALLWGPFSPMADAMSLLSSRPDQEDQQEGGGASLEGDTSPVSPLTSSSLSSSSSPPPFYSPPPSPPAVLLQGDKAGTDLLSLPWLGQPDHLRQAVSDDGKEELFGDLDWMAEKVDLSEFDIESLIGCDPAEDGPSSPEDLLASLDCSMELDSLPVPAFSSPVLSSPSSASPHVLPPPPAVCPDPPVIEVDEPESCVDEQDVPCVQMCVPEPEQELEIKSEPASPGPSSPVVDSPSSPAYTLDLGSEVDVSESEVKPVVASVVSPVQRIVLSLSPTRIVLVLAPKDEIGITTTTVTTTPQIVRSSPPPKSSRSRPYPEPAFKPSPPSPSATSVKVKLPRGADRYERVSSKAPKIKKLKKMEQNKTAATRYRQKKKAEQESLLEEHTRLERRNMELKEKAESMAREIEYLKELMEEVRHARTKKGLSGDF